MKKVLQAGGESRPSPLKTAIGAVSLFLFVIGLKRSLHSHEMRKILRAGETTDDAGEEEKPAASKRRSR